METSHFENWVFPVSCWLLATAGGPLHDGPRKYKIYLMIIGGAHMKFSEGDFGGFWGPAVGFQVWDGWHAKM